MSASPRACRCPRWRRRRGERPSRIPRIPAPGWRRSPSSTEQILELAAEAGATGAAGICLHLRGEVKRIYLDWLRSYRPDLLPRYEELYGRGAYAPKAERERLARLARHTAKPEPWARASRSSGASPRPDSRPEPPPRQATLF